MSPQVGGQPARGLVPRRSGVYGCAGLRTRPLTLASRRRLGVGLLTFLVAATASAASSTTGSWQRLPAAPVAPREALVSAWTGKEMLLVGRVTTQTASGVTRRILAAAYNPATTRWRRLPSPAPTGSFLDVGGAWTGKELLVWGQGVRAALDPATGRWRQLPGSRLLAIHDGFGLVAWTGKELIGWGGGCCGDAFDDGVAYDPRTNRWRALPRSPLAGSQHPLGAWTGKELIVLVGDTDPDGKRWPARLARAAAYDPATNAWRRIPRLPDARGGASVVWDGHELLVVGGAVPGPDGKPPRLVREGYAFDPSTSRWRALPPMETGRVDGVAAWTGKQLLVWGGRSSSPGAPRVTVPPHGLAYDPATNRWSSLPPAPLLGRLEPTSVWTGHQLLLWGGQLPKPAPKGGTRYFADGAAFTPSR